MKLQHNKRSKDKTERKPENKIRKAARWVGKTARNVAFATTLPLLAVASAGCESTKSNTGDLEPPPSCLNVEPTIGILEKDFQLRDSINIGQGIDAGCKILAISNFQSDNCADRFGPHVELRLFDENWEQIRLTRERITINDDEMVVYHQKDPELAGSGMPLQLSYPEGEYPWMRSPEYLEVDGKIYKFELIDSNQIKKIARIRITDMDSELPARIEERGLVECTPLDEIGLEGTLVIEGVLKETLSIFPSRFNVLAFEYNDVEHLLFVIEIIEHYEHGPMLQLGVAAGHTIYTNQYAQECSFLDLPCRGVADYRFYIDEIDTSSPREDWSVKIRINELM